MPVVRRNLPVYFALLAAALAFEPAFAAEDDIGAWAVVSASGRFGGESRVRYTIDAQARYFDIGTGINQYLVRPGVGLDLSARVSVWAGYARFRSRGRSGDVVDEDRFWQDVRWNDTFDNGGRLALRFRLIQRNLSISDEVGVLLRTQARYTFPAREGSSARFFIGAEPFVDLNTTEWNGGTGLAQNRIFAGMSWPRGERLRIEAAYMQQYFRIDGRENLLNHLAVIAFRF